jgi:pimeloyl-ACP methyl ester carboxylesterase
VGVSLSRFEAIEVRGQRTRLVDTGAGETVVVLHGWGGRIESMGPVIACLERRFRVLAWDLPGFGEAPAPAGVWGSSDYSCWVTEVLRSRSEGQAHFLGHSFGGKVSLNVAAGEPSAVDKLILVDPSGLRSAPSTSAQLKRMLSRAARMAGRWGAPGRRLQELIYARVASADYRNAGPLRATFVKVVNEDVSGLLARIAAPTLLLWGAQDRDVPLAHARTMERLIPDAGLVVLDPAGHFSYLDQPERFCRVVRHFLGAPVTP